MGLVYLPRRAGLVLFLIIWVKSPRTKNKKGFPIGDYKYAMKNVKADYLLECRSLQMEKEKLNAVKVENSQ